MIDPDDLSINTFGGRTLYRRRQTRVDSRSGDPYRVDSRLGASVMELNGIKQNLSERAVM